MKEPFIYLIGEDSDYLEKLCQYLQTHHVMRCSFRIINFQKLEELPLDGTCICLIAEGDSGEAFQECYKEHFPVLWIKEGGDKEKDCKAIEKYQSARNIGTLLTECYHHFYHVTEELPPLRGVFSLSDSFGLGKLCEFLLKQEKKTVLVNFSSFSAFPGQNHHGYLNISDFVMEQEGEIYQEECFPYEVADGIWGIQCPGSLEDYEEILKIKNLTFLQSYAAKLGAEQVVLYFGHQWIPWFSFAYHCHSLIGVVSFSDSFVKEWFGSFWKEKGANMPVRIVSEEEWLDWE